MTHSAVAQLEKRAARKAVADSLEAFGLTLVELAAALGVNRRTVYRYRVCKSMPSPRVRLQIEKLREIAQLLDEIFVSHDAQLKWLHTPVPLLRGRRPIDLMRRGELDQVVSVLAGLYTGAQA